MMSYGTTDERAWMLDEAAAEPIVKAAVDGGVTFFDTADMYSDGASEEITGRLLARLFAHRDDYALATKVYFPMGSAPNDRGLSRKHVLSAIDASLRRLGVDYVDLYQIHRWDYETPIEETMAALHDVVQAGKARYIGASSMFAWQFAKGPARGRALWLDQVRVDAESLQPALPGGKARNDPAVRRPGRRRAAVQPAGPRRARGQPDPAGRAADDPGRQRPAVRRAVPHRG
jgi:aryl-alcohol dehydrogenase-like predicted oxidoreductase